MEDTVIKNTFAEEVQFAISKFKDHEKKIKSIRLKINNSIKIYGKASYKFVTGYNKLRVAVSRVMNHENQEQLTDTIKHELAHIVDALIRGRSNHDDHWKEIAVKLGATPKATAKLENRSKIIATHVRTRRQTFHAYQCSCRVLCYKRAKKVLGIRAKKDETIDIACKKCKSSLVYLGQSNVETWKAYADKNKKEFMI